ncbi:MAG: MFS transporter [Verrucomicrobiales bacterium]|nr:MFS transporter [Verrucomicrobiales bacterium]
MTTSAPNSSPPRSWLGRLPFYAGWIQVGVAALAMVGTLPGRTQGLGLITESLLRDLPVDRGGFARINFWATLAGSLACVGFGRLMDRFGARVVLTAVSLALGTVVLGMSRVGTVFGLVVAITLSRALGQSALSVASLTLPPLWFSGRLPKAMAGYTVALSVGFMAAFPGVGYQVEHSGWRAAWHTIGLALVAGMAPLAFVLVRRSPEACGLAGDPVSAAGVRASDEQPVDSTFGEALQTPFFWVMALGSTLYGLVASGLGLFNESILQERGFATSEYHSALAVTAMTGLAGNFLGGGLMDRVGPRRLMAASLGLLALGLAWIPHLQSRAELFGQAALMGIAGGGVSVLFFSIWRRAFGRRELGRIQGAAQMLTVIGSAAGPVWFAEVVKAGGSYAPAFRILAGIVVLAGLGALAVRVPGSASESRRASA